MKFIKYNNIENATNKMVFDFKQSDLYDKDDLWVVTEKIHGSNFMFIVDENEVKVGKRSDYLSMDSNFFNFQNILDKYPLNNFKKLYEYIKENYDVNGEYFYQMSIHGELFGGLYPGAEILPNRKKVQKEIAYSNDTEFFIFDIRLTTEEGFHHFIPHDIVIELCELFDLMAVPIAYQGTLDECLKWSDLHNADPSDIWKLTGMEKEVEGNIREGHVIKPLDKTIYKGMNRMIFKDKNEKFKENKGKKGDSKPKIEYSDKLNQLLNITNDMLCINRFNSVISKYGDYSIKDFANIMNLLTDDIIDEFKRDGDYLEIYNDISEMEKKMLRDNIIRMTSKFMGKNKKELF